MSESDLPTTEPKHDPFAALRQRNFQLYSLSRIFSTLGNQMLQAILAWQIYEITGSPLSLGFLGLARFFPALALSLVGGTVADTYDRRKIMLISQMALLTCALTLGIATSGGLGQRNVDLRTRRDHRPCFGIRGSGKDSIPTSDSQA